MPGQRYSMVRRVYHRNLVSEPASRWRGYMIFLRAMLPINLYESELLHHHYLSKLYAEISGSGYSRLTYPSGRNSRFSHDSSSYMGADGFCASK